MERSEHGLCLQRTVIVECRIACVRVRGLKRNSIYQNEHQMKVGFRGLTSAKLVAAQSPCTFASFWRERLISVTKPGLIMIYLKQVSDIGESDSV